MHDRLLAALLQGAPQSPGQLPSGRPANARLLQALGQRRGIRPGDAKYRSLEALQPYGEQQHGDRFNGSRSLADGQGADGAFQWDAFQDDAYQV
jgi:hypothetical protein